MSLGTLLFKILKIISYLALAILLFGAISFFIPFLLDLCRNAPAATVSCDAPIYRTFYELGFTILMLAVFTGLPTLLALCGLYFLVKDCFLQQNKTSS